MQPTHTEMGTHFVAEVASVPKRCSVNSQAAMCVFSSVLFCSKVKAQEQWGYLQVCSKGGSFQMMSRCKISLGSLDFLRTKLLAPCVKRKSPK